MISNYDVLQEKARSVRLKVLDTIYKSGKGHIGGAYSCTDILVSLYYGNILKYDPTDAKLKTRDRFLLSKGHAAVSLYVILADLGYFNKKELNQFNNNSILGEHPDINIPGIEINSGSLGHGLGVGAGISFGAKLNNQKFKTYVLLGDGECNEGSVWEAALFASHHKLNNLIAIIDRNGLCIHGETENINKLSPLDKKFEAFGWSVAKIDGHSFEQIIPELKNNDEKKPKIIIADTIKGKGVSFMENKPNWHHGGISDEVFFNAKKELKSRY